MKANSFNDLAFGNFPIEDVASVILSSSRIMTPERLVDFLADSQNRVLKIKIEPSDELLKMTDPNAPLTAKPGRTNLVNFFVTYRD